MDGKRRTLVSTIQQESAVDRCSFKLALKVWGPEVWSIYPVGGAEPRSVPSKPRVRSDPRSWYLAGLTGPIMQSPLTMFVARNCT